MGLPGQTAEIGRDAGDIARGGAERGNEQARRTRGVEDIDRRAVRHLIGAPPVAGVTE